MFCASCAVAATFALIYRGEACRRGIAALCQNELLVQQLVAGQTLSPSAFANSDLSRLGADGLSPFHWACFLDDKDALTSMFRSENPPPLNLRAANGQTCLSLASEANAVQSLQILFAVANALAQSRSASGPLLDIDARGRDGTTPSNHPQPLLLLLLLLPLPLLLLLLLVSSTPLAAPPPEPLVYTQPKR